MADFTHRYPLNVPGKYYITGQCTDCDLCHQYAPQNIRRDDRTGISYVFKQPTTVEEVGACEAGVGGCPTEAVGNEGDKHDWEKTPIYDWNALYERHWKQSDIHFDIHAPLLGKPKRPWWKFW